MQPRRPWRPPPSAGLALLALLSAAPTRAAEEAPGVYRAACTVGMVTDIVRNIAGDRAEVRGLIGTGVDPHLYRATRADVARLLEADVVFYNGLMLEGRMTDALLRISRRGRQVHAVAEGVAPQRLLEAPGLEGHHDPHLWMDVVLWKECAGRVARVLAACDPAGATSYEQRYRRYGAELDELDAYARRVLATIPRRSRVLVTAHDAFHYFGRAYGLEVRGIQGLSTASEAGVEDINRLVRLLVERDIGAVFVETSVSARNVRALLEGAAAEGHRVRIGGALFSDAMGPPGTYEGTYTGMIDHNATTITRALGGQAPPRGLHGRLREAE